MTLFSVVESRHDIQLIDKGNFIKYFSKARYLVALLEKGIKMLLILLASSGKNKELAQEIERMAKELGITVSLLSLVEKKLPLYDGEKKVDEVKEQLASLLSAFCEANAFFVVSPEYNGGVPPVLSNALAWVSVGAGKNWRVHFAQKFAAVATFSGGPGTKVIAGVKAHLEHLGTNVLARSLSVSSSKPMNENSLKEILMELKMYLKPKIT